MHYGVKGDMRVKKEKIEIGYGVTGQSYLSDTRTLDTRTDARRLYKPRPGTQLPLQPESAAPTVLLATSY